MDKRDNKQETSERHRLYDSIHENKEGDLQDRTYNVETLLKGILIDVQKEKEQHDNRRKGKQTREGETQSGKNKGSVID